MTERVEHFLWTLPTTPMRLRRRHTDAGLVDEIFRGGQWQPTKRIVDHMAGNDDNVEPITEAGSPATTGRIPR